MAGSALKATTFSVMLNKVLPYDEPVRTCKVSMKRWSKFEARFVVGMHCPRGKGVYATKFGSLILDTYTLRLTSVRLSLAELASIKIFSFLWQMWSKSS